jgi:hypothetical protein
MKLKFFLFLLIITSLFLVSGFESPEYNIGIGIPSGEEGNIEVEITEPGIEITITNETVKPDSNPQTYSSSSGSRNSGASLSNNFPNSDLTDDSIYLDTTGNEKEDLDSEEKEQDEKGFVSRMTSAVIGTVGTAGAIAIPVFVFGVIGAVVFFKVRKK